MTSLTDDLIVPPSQRFFEELLKWRWVLLILVTGLIGMTASALPKLSKDTSADAFIDDQQPALVYKNKIEELFGLTDPIVIAIRDNDSDGIFDSQNLMLLQRLTRDIQKLPQVDPERVTSLATENYIVGNEAGILVDGFLEPKSELFSAQLASQQRAEQIRDAINDFPLYQGTLVARDGSTTLIAAELLNDDLATATYQQVMQIVKGLNLPATTSVHVAGEGAVMGYLSAYIDQDASRLNPMAAVIITLVLAIGFMSFRAAVLPNLIVAGTVLGSFGLMAASGTSFFVITNGLVVNLIGIAVADSIHILSIYYATLREHSQLSKKEIVARSMAQIWRPIVLTSITTMAGFLALSISSTMPPVQAFGRFGALGVFLALVYSMSLLPILLTLWPTKRIPRPYAKTVNGDQRIGLAERFMVGLGGYVLAAPAKILIVTAVIFIFGVAGALQLKIEEERIANFKPSEPIYQADKAINSAMDGIYSLDILVEAKEANGLHNPELLRRIERLQKFLETLPHVNGSTSIVDYVKQLHRSVQNGRSSDYVIPDNPDLIAQLFFLYGASADPTDFEEEVDYDFQNTLVRGQVDNGRYSTNKQIVPVLESYLLEHFNDEVATATVTGRVTVSYYWFQGVDQATALSVVLSLAAVTLAAILLFQSVSLGLLAVTPVGFAILMVYSVMGWFGIPIDIGTSMFAAIAIGLSIDFAIHALDKLRELAQQGGLSSDCFIALYPETGRALLFNFLAVAGGFGVLMTSQVPPLIKFGSLVAVAVTTAFLASVTLLPALLLVLKPSALINSTSEEVSHVVNQQAI